MVACWVMEKRRPAYGLELSKTAFGWVEVSWPSARHGAVIGLDNKLLEGPAEKKT